MNAAAAPAVHVQALRGPELLAVGSIRIGCVDPTTMRPRRIPDELQQALSTQGRESATTP